MYIYKEMLLSQVPWYSWMCLRGGPGDPFFDSVHICFDGASLLFHVCCRWILSAAKKDDTDEDIAKYDGERLLFLSPPVLMHGGFLSRFLSARLSVCLWLDQNYWTIIHISRTVWVRVTKFGMAMNIDTIYVMYEGQGHRLKFTVTMSKMWFD